MNPFPWLVIYFYLFIINLLSTYLSLSTFLVFCQFLSQIRRWQVNFGGLHSTFLQCGGSVMFIPDPGSKNSNKEKGWKKIFCQPFLNPQISQNWILFYFWYAEEKNLAQFSKNYWSSCPKNCHRALKNMGLGSEIRDPEKTYSGSRGQKGTGAGSATLLFYIWFSSLAS